MAKKYYGTNGWNTNFQCYPKGPQSVDHSTGDGSGVLVMIGAAILGLIIFTLI